MHMLLCVRLLLQWLPPPPPLLLVAAHALARSARMRSAAPRGDAQFILPACMLLCLCCACCLRESHRRLRPARTRDHSTHATRAEGAAERWRHVARWASCLL